MYRKITSNDRLNKKQGLFFSIGLLISMLFVIAAFEWKTEVKPVEIPEASEDKGIIIIDPIPTRHEIPERPKPKRKMTEKAKKAVDIVEIKIELEKITVDVPSIDFTETDPVPIVDLKKEKAPVYIGGGLVTKPTFEGGLEAFYRYISENIQYVNKNVEGTIVLGFIINKKGELTEVKVLKGLDKALEKEAIKALESSPLWSPGIYRGLPVNVRMQIPIKFGLRNR